MGKLQWQDHDETESEAVAGMFTLSVFKSQIAKSDGSEAWCWEAGLSHHAFVWGRHENTCGSSREDAQARAEDALSHVLKVAVYALEGDSQ